MQYQTERIMIDPQRLMHLKKKKQALRMVPSTFEAPPQQQIITNHFQPLQQPSQIIVPSKLSSDVPNIEFIASLIPNNLLGNILTFQEGDCIPWQHQQCLLLIQGHIQVMGINGSSFDMGKGYIFFLTKQTKKKISQIIALTMSKLCKIPKKVMEEYIRNYFFVKNAQKIKYLKYCPFLVWSEALCEDLAICMELVETEKDQAIYHEGDEAQNVYFVKEGIILLQRNSPITNPVIHDYQMHYQKDEANQNDILMVVRKGMVFGIDGILLKQKYQTTGISNPQDPSSRESGENLLTDNQKVQKWEVPITIINKRKQSSNQQISKKSPSNHKQQRMNSRIYNARSIGRCQLYKIRKSVLSTFFSLNDLLKFPNKKSEVASKQLNRICLQYTNLLAGGNRAHKSLKNLNFVFKQFSNPQLELKKGKVKNIIDYETKVKKITLENIMRGKSEKQQKHKNILAENQNPFDSEKYKRIFKMKSNSKPQKSQIVLPILTKKSQYITRSVSRENFLKHKQLQQYKILKKKIEDYIVGGDVSKNKEKMVLEVLKTPQKQTNKQKKQLFMQVKSYRSILSSFS